MQLQENISLKPYNTFRIDVEARYFAKFRSVEDLQSILSNDKSRASNSSDLSKTKNFILGGGSNILFAKNYDGLVLKNEILGIQKVKEDNDHIYVTAGAGENWHKFVLACIENEWAGVENLSLIPGNVGASPMQNIGAYGVEIKEVFHELKAFHIHERSNYTFGIKDCDFGYRDSVFKKKYKDQFIILNVTYKLRKKPVFNISYGTLAEELEKMKVKDLTIKTVSDAVIRIRSSKLPDPAQIGNAGSFFKNPVVEATHYKKLLSQFPGIIGHENPDGSVKLAAGWLIEHAGPNSTQSWKGYRRGDAGCHEKQALVLVNHENASGREINDLADEIAASVREKYDVNLEKEVNII